MKNLNKKMEESGFQHLELKANLNPEQREYLDVLKDKMKKVLNGKTKQELAQAGDLTSLKNYKSVLTEILDFLKTKEISFDFLMARESRELVDYEEYMISKPQVQVLMEIEKLLIKAESTTFRSLTPESARTIVAGRIEVENGNIIDLNLSHINLRVLPNLTRLNYLKKLDCRFCHLVFLPRLRYLKELRILRASDNNFPKREIKRIKEELSDDCEVDF